MTYGSFPARIERAMAARPTSITPLASSRTGRVVRVTFADGRAVVAKTGGPGLDAEARQLRFLAEYTELPVPEVYYGGEDLLVMEDLSPDGWPAGEDESAGGDGIDQAVEPQLADHLANLHAVTADRFGFEFDTFLGGIPLENDWQDSWVAFYRDRRLRPALARARTRRHLPPGVEDRLTRLFADLDRVVDEPDAPSLLHGNLGKHHILADSNRVYGFVDPACYYGHPEVELAFLDWAGIVGSDFFARYRTHRRIRDGYEDRRHAYILYPQLVLLADGRTEFIPHLVASLDVLGY